MTTNQLVRGTNRSLTTTALAAALQAHRQATLAEIAEMPTAADQEKRYQMPLTCQYSGAHCGELLVKVTAGYMPLLSQWKQQQVLHPLFSLDPIPLLKFSKNAWIRYCAFSAEESENEQLVARQELQLRIAALAMLHQLTDVRQDVPWLPSFLEVQKCWQSLISISYWKAYLDSNRFKFPSLRISKMERCIDLRGFLDACWDKKKSYETEVNEIEEEAKLAALDKLVIRINDEVGGKRPLAPKLLWNWFCNNVSAKYTADTEGWMKTIFFAKADDLQRFTVADIELFEEIFLSEMEAGSVVSNAFMNVLRTKRTQMETYFESFEIMIPQELTAQADSGEIPVAEPKKEDFAKLGLYIIARAKWQLTHGNKANSANRAAVLAKQGVATVKPSFIPRLDTGRSRDFAAAIEADEDAIDTDAIGYVAPGAVNAINESQE